MGNGDINELADRLRKRQEAEAAWRAEAALAERIKREEEERKRADEYATKERLIHNFATWATRHRIPYNTVRTKKSGFQAWLVAEFTSTDFSGPHDHTYQFAVDATGQIYLATWEVVKKPVKVKYADLPVIPLRAYTETIAKYVVKYGIPWDG